MRARARQLLLGALLVAADGWRRQEEGQCNVDRSSAVSSQRQPRCPALFRPPWRRAIRCRPGTTAPAKQAIVDFVARVTTQGSRDFVPLAERIATFDNDGTLWTEQPIYFQFAFAFDRVKALAPQHPEWRTKQPFKVGAGRRHARGSR